MVETHELKGQLVEDEEAAGNVNNEYDKNSEENHHAIPRKDFGKYIGHNDNENGSG